AFAAYAAMAGIDLVAPTTSPSVPTASPLDDTPATGVGIDAEPPVLGEPSATALPSSGSALEVETAVPPASGEPALVELTTGEEDIAPPVMGVPSSSEDEEELLADSAHWRGGGPFFIVGAYAGPPRLPACGDAGDATAVAEMAAAKPVPDDDLDAEPLELFLDEQDAAAKAKASSATPSSGAACLRRGPGPEALQEGAAPELVVDEPRSPAEAKVPPRFDDQGQGQVVEQKSVGQPEPTGSQAGGSVHGASSSSGGAAAEAPEVVGGAPAPSEEYLRRQAFIRQEQMARSRAGLRLLHDSRRFDMLGRVRAAPGWKPRSDERYARPEGLDRTLLDGPTTALPSVAGMGTLRQPPLGDCFAALSFAICQVDEHGDLGSVRAKIGAGPDNATMGAADVPTHHFLGDLVLRACMGGSGRFATRTFLPTAAGVTLWFHFAMCFGAAASVWNFNRAADAVQMLLSALLLVLLGHFVDDFNGVDSYDTAESAHHAVAEFFFLLGLQTKPSKAQEPATRHVVQGVDLSIRPEGVELAPTAKRTQKILEQIDGALADVSVGLRSALLALRRL
ncbi:PUB3, partial [Symbiodinium microadriaticum]